MCCIRMKPESASLASIQKVSPTPSPRRQPGTEDGHLADHHPSQNTTSSRLSDQTLSQEGHSLESFPSSGLGKQDTFSMSQYTLLELQLLANFP